jgi:hypothetical protein
LRETHTKRERESEGEKEREELLKNKYKSDTERRQGRRNQGAVLTFPTCGKATPST